MPSKPDDVSLTRLYDSLSRFQWWRKKLRRLGPGVGLEMHKQLNIDPTSLEQTQDGDAFHTWFFSHVDSNSIHRVLDVGCGFGASLLYLMRREDVMGLGLSLSPFQIRKARSEAESLLVDDRVSFRRQSFDEPIDGTFDLVLSIESLFHSPDLNHSLSHIVEHLRPGGTLMILEDMAVDRSVREDQDAVQWLQSWATLQLHTVQDYLSRLEELDLVLIEQKDFSSCVRHRDLETIKFKEQRLQRYSKWAPSQAIKRVFEAFRGGLLQERLFARERLCYRLLVAQKPLESSARRAQDGCRGELQ